MSSNEIILGRQYPRSKHPLGEHGNKAEISRSAQVSRQAAKIYFNSQSEDFVIKNIGKRSIMVDREILAPKKERLLQHKSLLMIGDSLLFFLNSQETLEKKKKWLKEKRKIILEEISHSNPPKNNFDFGATGKR